MLLTLLHSDPFQSILTIAKKKKKKFSEKQWKKEIHIYNKDTYYISSLLMHETK